MLFGLFGKDFEWPYEKILRDFRMKWQVSLKFILKHIWTCTLLNYTVEIVILCSKYGPSDRQRSKLIGC